MQRPVLQQNIGRVTITLFHQDDLQVSHDACQNERDRDIQILAAPCRHFRRKGVQDVGHGNNGGEERQDYIQLVDRIAGDIFPGNLPRLHKIKQIVPSLGKGEEEGEDESHNDQPVG